MSVPGARRDYGVVLGADGDADEAATEALRASMRDQRPDVQPFFDRGPGYALLSGGESHNEFDLL